jgi:hypothetical protein
VRVRGRAGRACRYQHYEKVENGDLNEILPGKFIAFSGPSATRLEIGDGLYTLAPEDYHSIFRKKGITAIVRLNKKVATVASAGSPAEKPAHRRDALALHACVHS